MQLLVNKIHTYSIDQAIEDMKTETVRSCSLQPYHVSNCYLCMIKLYQTSVP